MDIENIVEKITTIFEATEEALASYAWQDGKNLQIPVLLGMIALKLGWDEKLIKINDPIIRFYLRTNTTWDVTKGAHGGVRPASKRQKQEELKAEKEAIKAQMRAEINAKVDSNE